jgi:DNA adenine methylase
MSLDIIVSNDDDQRMQYPGGKGKCYQRLISLMPPHTTYLESHLGGGAVLRHKRPARVNIGIDADPKVIEAWQRENAHLCMLVHDDAASFLASYSFEGGELVYADPPYLAEVRRRPKVYRHDYTAADHDQLLEVLTALPCHVMVSGYDSTMYRDRLRHWRRVTFAAKTHVDVREESVWLNFDPPTALHDASHLGETFRERQTIRRRLARVMDKFGRMHPVERHQVLTLLKEKYGARPVGA